MIPRWVVALVPCLLATSIAWAEAPADRSAEARALVIAYLDAHRLPRDHFDTDAVIRSTARALERGATVEEVQARISGEARIARLAEAPKGAVPDPAARYRMPFDIRFPRYLSSSSGEAFHEGEGYHSLDFTMPIGTAILAARAGRVIHVDDGFTETGWKDENSERANSVFVLHEDGTVAMYLHLSPGVPAREGQQVRSGQVIGFAGETGYAEMPQLHFSVVRLPERGPRESLPVRFGQGRGFWPTSGQRYGWMKGSNVDLEVWVDGAPASRLAYVALAEGESVDLTVWMRQGGLLREVTNSPHVEVSTLSPLGFRVEGMKVTALPAEGFEEAAGYYYTGHVRVVYERGKRRGFFDVGFLWPGHEAPPPDQPLPERTKRQPGAR